MVIPEQDVERIVNEASAKMSDPSYSAGLVEGFVQNQHAAAQYITSKQNTCGGAEGVVNVISVSYTHLTLPTIYSV